MTPAQLSAAMSALGTPEYSAVLMSTPSSDVVICSPIVGDPDLTKNESISDVQSMVVGFSNPGPGILTEIHIFTQRVGKVAGNATPRNVRWSVCTVLPDTTPGVTAGIKVGEVLGTGISTVTSATLGDVPLATGLTLAVPEKFILCIKAPFDTTEANKIIVQNCMSGGPIAGVYGTVGGGLVSAATYTVQIDIDAVNPQPIVPGAGITISGYKGLSVYIKWRKQ